MDVEEDDKQYRVEKVLRRVGGDSKLLENGIKEKEKLDLTCF